MASSHGGATGYWFGTEWLVTRRTILHGCACVLRQKQEPRRAWPGFLLRSTTICRSSFHYQKNLNVAVGLVGVVYVCGRDNVTVLHVPASALLVFQLYW